MNHFWKPILKSLKKELLLLPLFIILLFWWGAIPDRMGYDGWSALASVFCVMVNPAVSDFVSAAIGLVPYVIFIYSFSQEYREDFLINYCYVFTRYRGRGAWAMQKAVQLLLTVSIHFLLLFLGVIAVAMCMGYRFPISVGMLCMTLLLYLSITLGIYLFLLAANILSLPMGGTRAYFLTIAAYMLLAFGSVGATKGTGSLSALLANPAAQGMYFFHGDAIVPPVFGMTTGAGAEGFFVFYSLVYLAAAAVLVQGAFIWALNHKDLISMMGGES